MKIDLDAVPPIAAAQYVRMSTDQQDFSIENQIDAIREYADARGIKVVKTYADPGQSGLTLRERPALQRLLADVGNKRTPFSMILVYDVSRWGRFQDPDEAAAYEFHCRSNGVHVAYCLEGYDPHGLAPADALLKTMKRSMSAQFSRELSITIARAKLKLAMQGRWVFGRPPFGYQRVAVADDGRRIPMKAGESRHSSNWRTLLEPGPASEVAAVRRIFTLFANHERCVRVVARTMNAEGFRTRRGFKWVSGNVRAILANEIYAGDMVFNRTTRRLKAPIEHLPRDQWIRVRDACSPIVSRRDFAKAQQRLPLQRPDGRTWSDEKMLDALTALGERYGKITRRLVVNDRTMPSDYSYTKRFGTFGAAVILSGAHQAEYPGRLNRLQQLKTLRTKITGDLRLELANLGVDTEQDTPARFNMGKVSVAVCPATRASRTRVQDEWIGRFPPVWADLLVAIRLDDDRKTVLDYRILQRKDFKSIHISLRPTSKAMRFARIAPDLPDAARQLSEALRTAQREPYGGAV